MADTPQLPPPEVVAEALRGVTELFNPALPPQLLAINLVATTSIISRCCYVAAQLKLADRLAQGPRPVDELARETGTNPDSLYRLMCLLESTGLFAQESGRRFRNTPVGHGFRSDIPGSAHGMLAYLGAPWRWDLFSDLHETVRTGNTVFQERIKTPLFQWLDSHPKEAGEFYGAMSSVSEVAAMAILAVGDFKGLRSLVDVGGGLGNLLAPILGAYPDIQGTLFDLPPVIEAAKAKGPLGELERAGRCQLVGGDFFKDVPAGKDAYLLKWILHDWNDEQSKQILSVIRKAAGPGKRLLLVEIVVDAVPQRAVGARATDIDMMVMTGGRERTEQEYRNLMSATGFELKRVIPTMTAYSIIEGVSV